jgi:DnaJ like chaperone protein
MAADRQQPEIRSILDRVGSEVDVCTLLVLALVMRADEGEDPEETALLNRIAESSGFEAPLVAEVVRLARRRDVPSIEYACRVLRNRLDDTEQVRFLELCIGMMTADRYVSVPEQYVLRFLADLFEVGPEELDARYESMVGQPPPQGGDPGDPDWWEGQGRGRSDGESRAEEGTGDELSSKDRRAYAVLGLDPGASSSEIKDAYRELAQVHHPDRFEKIGDEAVTAATERFRLIQESYDHLTE